MLSVRQDASQTHGSLESKSMFHQGSRAGRRGRRVFVCLWTVCFCAARVMYVDERWYLLFIGSNELAGL